MTPDEKLNSLLKQCKGIEPGPGFESAVWRRLHAAQPLPMPVWRARITLLAVAAGFLIGLGLGVMFPPGGKAGTTRAAMIRNGSLTGAYLALSLGGDQ
ncbi:MAG: hypothetical protein WCG36_10385 [bacterium]